MRTKREKVCRACCAICSIHVEFVVAKMDTVVSVHVVIANMY